MNDSDCPFCTPDAERVFYEGSLTLGAWDAFPVSEGHALLVTRRHVETFFEASREEQAELLEAIAIARSEVESRHQPDGFNIGINIGESAGQTVPHLHIHLIPRYKDDVFDPRGGVRHVIPARANYLRLTDIGSDRVADGTAVGFETVSSSPLVRGDDDPLAPCLLGHLDDARETDILASFVLRSGVEILETRLRDLLDRGGSVRILTGDYLGITEPAALLRLHDLHQEFGDKILTRVFESAGQSFHPKAYIFRGSFGRFGDGARCAFADMKERLRGVASDTWLNQTTAA